MSLRPTIPTSRRAVPRLQQIQSPLTRVGLGLPAEVAHLVLIEAGQIRLMLDGAEALQAEAPRVIWRPADLRRGELLAEAGSRVTVLGLPTLALTGALPPTALGDQMRRTLGQDLAFAGDPEGRLAPLLAGLREEQRQDAPGADVAVTQYLTLILLQLWRAARVDLVNHGHAPQGLAERFVAMAGQRVRDHLGVGAYAQALGVSRDRLGTAVRRATGHAPQAYLHLLLIREASELLASTGMPVGQVAFRLGFADPAYFTRFFTRHRGESPAQFRRAAKARRAAGDMSYAAWP